MELFEATRLHGRDILAVAIHLPTSLSPLPYKAFVTGHCLALSNQCGTNSISDGCSLAHKIPFVDAGRFESCISWKLLPLGFLMDLPLNAIRRRLNLSVYLVFDLEPRDSNFWVKISLALERSKMTFPLLFSGTSEAETLVSRKVNVHLLLAKTKKVSFFEWHSPLKSLQSAVCILTGWSAVFILPSVCLQSVHVVHSLHFTLTDFQFQSKPVFSI